MKLEFPNPIEWVVSKIHPDFNKNGIDDIKELKAALEELSVKVQHAIETLDYKTMLVHLTDIAEALQAIIHYMDLIKRAVTTDEVKEACAALKIAAEQFLNLLKSFAEAQKVAMLDRNSKDIA